MTDNEIVQGIMAAADPRASAFWLRRVIDDLAAHVSDPSASKFVDLVDNEASALFTDDD